MRRVIIPAATASLDGIDAALGELLSRFPAYLKNRWIALPDARGYFGDGTSGENGIRSNASVAFTAALLGTRSVELGIDAVTAGLLRQRCVQVLRYLCDSHSTGVGQSAAGGRWGLEWQSAWWSAKMGLAVRLLDDNDADRPVRAAVERVIVAEANRQLGRVVPTGLHLDTKAEENAWDAEVLAVALALLPGHPNSGPWRDKLIEFSANVLSAPQDAASPELLDGMPIRDRVYTCNLHGDYSLENHGSFHFCYVASPLLSKAWCTYALGSAGAAVPDAVFHNVKPLWALARHTFLSHRFAYIGGQDWARYAYGEYFIVPALVMLQDVLADPDAGSILAARLAFLAGEARGNADGSFFGARFTRGRFGGQEGKYETDCFACLALAWALRRLLPRQVGSIASEAKSETVRHVSPQGQFCFQRTLDCFFSFSWTTLGEDVPMILMVPLGDDSLAEWHPGNLVGTVRTAGHQTIGVRAMKATDRGLRIEGRRLVRSRRGRGLVEHFLTVDFDAQAGSVEVVSRYVARARLWRAVIVGMNLRLPNDMFNDHSRTLTTSKGRLRLVTSAAQRDPARSRQRRSLVRRALDKLLGFIGREGSSQGALAGSWFNVDDRLGVVVNEGQRIVLRRFRGRQSSGGSLFVEQFEAPGRHQSFFVQPGATLLDSRLIIHVGNAERTEALARAAFVSRSDEVDRS